MSEATLLVFLSAVRAAAAAAQSPSRAAHNLHCNSLATAACDSLIHASDAVHWSTCLVAAVAARLASATPSNPNKSLMLRGSWAASFGFEVCQHPQVLLHHGVKRVHAVVECAAVGIAGAAGVLMAVNFEGNGSSSSLQHSV